MKKNVFTFALALLTATSAWAYDFKAGDLYYNITDEANKTVEVTYEYEWYESNNYSSLPGVVSIPETVSYNSTTYSVTSIGEGAFYSCSALTQVTIPGSVESIGNYAFSGCSALTQVTIPGSVTSIGEGAFYGCSALTQVTIPNGVESIGDEAFSYCSALTQVTIPNSVTSIGSSAFAGCSKLTQVTLPESVTSIGDGAFEGCGALTAVYYTGDVAGWCGITFTGYTSNPLSCAHNLYIGNTLVTKLVIPEGVTEIKGGAFYGCSATQVSIPNSVTSIGDYAFCKCSALRQINIPDGVTSIGEATFGVCSALKQITLPESVTSIGDEAFSDCYALAEITVLPTVPPTIRAKTFYKINLQVKVSVPEGSKDAYMADESWKKLLDLSAGEISGTCGDNLTWTFTTADSTLTISGTGNMYDYTSHYMNQPWSNCNRYIKKISLQNGLTSIGNCAFSYCSALTQVTIPESVESIGGDAFEGCSQLSVYKNFSMAVATKYSFDSHFTLSYLTALDTLVCPAEELNVITDQELLLCSKQVKSIEVHSGTVTAEGFAYIKRQQNTLPILDMGTTENTELDNLALYDCYALEKLTLPAGLERIGYKAVAECVGLQAIDIPAGVTEIDDRAFENCRSISSISFGQESGQKSTRSTASSLKRIGNWAFYNCHQLQELAIPEGVTEIGNAAFYGCTYLENLELPASVQAIGDNCFALCSKLQAITVQATTPPTIAAKTFYDVNRDIPVYVPAEALEDYQNDTYWQEFNLHAMPTGLQTPSMPESIRVYGGMLHNPQGLPVSIYDMQGRMVYSVCGALRRRKQQGAVLNSRKPKALIPPEMETFPAVFVW